jgi:glycosyltransferase involved in cell wall biosynthesis
MKILIVSDDFPPKSYGGAGIVASNIANCLKDRGYEVSVFTANEKHFIPERWRSYLSLYNPKVIGDFKKVLSDFKPDIVHFHNVHSHISYYTIVLAKKSGAKVFVTLHDAMSVYYGKVPVKNNDTKYKVTLFEMFKVFGLRVNPFRNIVIKYIFSYVDKIFTVSDSLREFLIINDIQNMVTIHNGIDIDSFKSYPDMVREYKNNLGIKENDKVLLFGGRLSNMKGAKLSIDSFIKVLEKMDNIRLLIVGNVPKQDSDLIKYAKDNGVSDKIIFTGWVDHKNMASIYYLSDIVLVPSIYLDPFPNINLEAMACGKPIIGTVYGGTKEAVRDQVNGLLINPFDTKQYYQAIFDLLNNKDLYTKMGKKGKEIVEKEFNIDKQIDEILVWYNS